MKNFTGREIEAMEVMHERKVSMKDIGKVFDVSASTINRRLNPQAAEINRVYARGYAAGKRSMK